MIQMYIATACTIQMCQVELIHAANISTMAVIYSVLHTLNFNMKLDLLTNDDSHVIYTD